MNKPVYLDYNQTALDTQYNARAAVPAFDAFVKRWLADSKQPSSELSCTLDVPYGESDVEILDIFHPAHSGPAPVLMFFHGGYWRAGDKSWFHFLARPFVERGAMFVIPKYGLAPRHNMDELVKQCRRAVAWTHRHASEYGGDSTRLFISGHSAGGHITGMMLATDWAAHGGMPADTVKGITGISGLYDLEPIRLSHVNEPLQLTKASAERNSPVRQTLSITPPATLLAYGALESNEYARQASAYAAALQIAGGAPDSMGIHGHHHFSVLDAFANPEHNFGCAVLKQIGLA
ncbi:MAG: esterase [Rickettsiales bacterium]|nr:esterase [Rickettsiales bacterium]